MRNTKKAFTLVELIVVITILAILGTIAFISFGGQTADARNTKVTSDIRNIASGIEVATSGANAVVLVDIVTGTTPTDAGSRATQNALAAGSTFGSGSALAHDTANNIYYRVGNVNFSRIGQNGEDFKDPNAGVADNDYIFAVVSSPDFKGYHIAGQIIENDMKKARINGTYFQQESTDSLGLIKPRTGNDALENGDDIGLGEAFNLY